MTFAESKKSQMYWNNTRVITFGGEGGGYFMGSYISWAFSFPFNYFAFLPNNGPNSKVIIMALDIVMNWVGLEICNPPPPVCPGPNLANLAGGGGGGKCDMAKGHSKGGDVRGAVVYQALKYWGEEVWPRIAWLQGPSHCKIISEVGQFLETFDMSCSAWLQF